jgi:hypothetical protein
MMTEQQKLEPHQHPYTVRLTSVNEAKGSVSYFTLEGKFEIKKKLYWQIYFSS